MWIVIQLSSEYIYIKHIPRCWCFLVLRILKVYRIGYTQDTFSIRIRGCTGSTHTHTREIKLFPPLASYRCWPDDCTAATESPAGKTNRRVPVIVVSFRRASARVRFVPCRAVSFRVSPCSAACVRQTNVFIFPTERKREKREEREERKKERREGKGAGDKTQYFRLSFSCSLVVAEPAKDLDKLLALVRQRSSAWTLHFQPVSQRCVSKLDPWSRWKAGKEDKGRKKESKRLTTINLPCYGQRAATFAATCRSN